MTADPPSCIHNMLCWEVEIIERCVEGKDRYFWGLTSTSYFCFIKPGEYSNYGHKQTILMFCTGTYTSIPLTNHAMLWVGVQSTLEYLPDHHLDNPQPMCIHLALHVAKFPKALNLLKPPDSTSKEIINKCSWLCWQVTNLVLLAFIVPY